MIKVTLENWLDTLYFETTQEVIDEYNENFGDETGELDKENNYTVDTSDCFEEEYLHFDNNAEFILVSRNKIDVDNVSCKYGILFEFINCKCPEKLNKHLVDDYLLFDDNYNLVDDKDSIKKISDDFAEGYGSEIDNNGTGCVKFSEIDKIFKYFGIKNQEFF